MHIYNHESSENIKKIVLIAQHEIISLIQWVTLKVHEYFQIMTKHTRPPDKNAYLEITIHISQPKNMP